MSTADVERSARVREAGEAAPSSNHPRIRAAILCDFTEEGWPSMDLIGNMLSRNLADHCGHQIAAIQVRPRMRRSLSRIAAQNGFAWNADRLLNRFAVYPRWLRAHRSKYDLFHIVDHSYSQLVHSLPPERTVVTCHDLDTFRCLLDPEQERRPAWFRAMTRRILSGLQMAGQVITVSTATRNELLRYRLVDDKRISVIHNGVDVSCSPEPDAQADAAVARFLGEAGDGPLLLNVGSTIRRKRLDVLLRVFAKVRSKFPEARLVRVGGLTRELAQLAKELSIDGAVVTVPFLDRQQLAAMYRRAWLLLHTAEAEGFGLPVLEAQACGCPVVTSDIPVLREAGGPAVSYCPVANVSVWSETVCQLLSQRNEKPVEWEQKRGQALDWAARFSWADNARLTTSVYKRLLELHSPAPRNQPL